MSGKYDSRYAEAMPAYNRPAPPERRRSPSPRSAFHERYPPSRIGPPYREEYPSNYRTDAWRTERATYNRTPSPERFRDTRSIHPEPQQTWPRQPMWRSPESPQWVDKRQAQAPVYDSSWHRARRDVVPDRMFEPSDNWKQSHPGGSEYQDGFGRERAYESSFDYNRRPERSPDRLSRDNYSYQEARYPYRSPPHVNRDIPSYSNPRSNVYRPQYGDRESWESRYPPDSFTSPSPTRPEGRPREQHVPYEPRPRLGFAAARDPPITSPQPSPPNTRNSWVEGGRRGSIHSNLGDNRRPPHYTPPDTHRAAYRSRSSSFSSEISRSRYQQPQHKAKSPSPDNHTESLASTPHGDRTAASRVPSPVSPASDLMDQVVPHQQSPKPATQEVEQPDDHDIYGQSGPTGISVSEPDKDVLGIDISTDVTNVSTGILPSSEIPPIHPTSYPEAIDLVSEESAPGLADISQSFEIEALEPVVDESPPEIVPSRQQTASPSIPATPVKEPKETRVVTTAIIPQTVVVPERPPPPPSSPVQVQSLSHALQMVVMMRLRCDHQTREERVAPVLAANMVLAGASSSKSSVVPSSPSVVHEVVQGERRKAREEAFGSVKPSLEVRFAQREVDLNEKVQRLREEYLTLHDRWLLHCAKLDEKAKAGALEEAAATAGRTTRRTTANLGDAVRSDLEMEQIIASLGNEELTDANHLSARNAATIPDMITVTNGEVDHLYDDTNNLVDDPVDFYAPRTGTDDWTEDEVNIFLRKFAEHPKQFGIIADSLPHKTTAQCVTFYYLHKKKHLDFRKVVAKYAVGKRGRGRKSTKKKGNALLADILKRDAEVSREHTPVTTAGRRTKPVLVTNGETKKPPAGRRHASQVEQTPASTPTPDPEPEPRKKRRRVTTARAAASMEQDANQNDIDAEARPKRGRKARKVKAVDTATTNSPIVGNEEAGSLPAETKFIDQTELTASAKRKSQQGNVVWSDEDKAQFLILLSQYGDDFKRIAASMPNKTTVQVSSFYKSNLIEMDLEKVASGAPKCSPTPEVSLDAWKDGTSGILTPNSGITGTPSETILLNGSMETRFRVNGRPIPSRSSPNDQSSADPVRFRSATVESSQPRRSASAEPGRLMEVHPVLPSGSTSDTLSTSNDLPLGAVIPVPIAHPSPFAASLTTTFPSSFPYTNLSPSHFTNGGHSGGPLPPSRAGVPANGDTPGSGPPAVGPSVHTFDASFTRWTHQS